ncbi:MAG: DEAD/DEAH box helicase [Verrucomicrobiota bacterium]
MKIQELRSTLRDSQLIDKDPFSVLQAISNYVNDEESDELARDLVLRALDKRKAFSDYSEILEALTREVGLFPYLDPEELGLRDRIAYELHRPFEEAEFVFHRAQAEVFRRLMDGENVILSAPTSFGKSRIIDSAIESGKFRNMAIVVPTIALIDETRRRLSKFAPHYKVISQLSQKPTDRNLFVFTAERLIAYDDLPPIDFFVIDEFYKIGAIGVDDGSRAVALNQAFYRLNKGGGQFYLLGPSIRAIPEGLETKLPCYFIPTKFATVACDIVNVFEWSNEIAKLVEICKTLDEPTLIFCKSPKRVNEVARALLENELGFESPDMQEPADWVAANYHRDWVYASALKQGIGLHHGRLPRSLGQLSVRSFNSEKLRFLVCTSTLIEGVNTCAKNVIIFDHVINRKKIDFFTFNNVKGRSGRMFEHFIGRVFLFHPPPDDELPFVDFPSITQDATTPDSLLVQIDAEDLTSDSKERMEDVYSQKFISVEIIKKNSTLDPSDQIALAEYFTKIGKASAIELCWTNYPTYAQLKTTVELIWKFFIKKPKNEVFSAAQLILKVWRLKDGASLSSRVLDELQPGKYQAESADEAVERVLGFDRNWAGFEFPRLLSAMSRIQGAVFQQRFGFSGSYFFYAGKVERLFRSPSLIALEEYGLPLEVGEKISQRIKLSDDLDTAIAQIRKINSADLRLSNFESEILEDVKANM